MKRLILALALLTTPAQAHDLCQKLKIEVGKTYLTRGGAKVRIYATDGAGIRSVHGAYLRDSGWVLTWWTAEGCGHEECSRSLADLVEESK